MILSKVTLLSLIGLATAAIPTPPTTTIIDPSSASLNGYPTELISSSTSVSTSETSTVSSVSSTSSTSSRTRSSRTYTSRTHKPTHTSRTHKPTHTSRTHKPTHTRTHHSKTTDCTTECRHTDHHRPHKTKTITTWINHKPCWLLVYPCPTNTTSMTTSTVTVAPTSAAVAPTQAAAPVCTPCTSYVTKTVMPSVVCTTMVFCDLADQSENCRHQEAQKIESMVSAALRDGGQVFVNGELVVFESSSGTSVAVISGTSVVTVTGQNANAAASSTGFTLFNAAAILGAVFLFA